MDSKSHFWQSINTCSNKQDHANSIIPIKYPYQHNISVLYISGFQEGAVDSGFSLIKLMLLSLLASPSPRWKRTSSFESLAWPPYLSHMLLWFFFFFLICFVFLGLWGGTSYLAKGQDICLVSILPKQRGQLVALPFFTVCGEGSQKHHMTGMSKQDGVASSGFDIQ